MLRPRCFFDSISGLKMARSTDTGLWWRPFERRMARQRLLGYLGELNGSADARWQKTVEGLQRER